MHVNLLEFLSSILPSFPLILLSPPLHPYFLSSFLLKPPALLLSSHSSIPTSFRIPSPPPPHAPQVSWGLPCWNRDSENRLENAWNPSLTSAASEHAFRLKSRMKILKSYTSCALSVTRCKPPSHRLFSSRNRDALLNPIPNPWDVKIEWYAWMNRVAIV